MNRGYPQTFESVILFQKKKIQLIVMYTAPWVIYESY